MNRLSTRTTRRKITTRARRATASLAQSGWMPMNIPEKSTVCVYDPKTGWRGLSFPQMNELAAAAHRLFGYRPKYIIVTEVRPGQH